MATPNEIIDFINASFPYPLNREILFGSDRVAFRHVRGATPLIRIALLGAALLYIKWKRLSRKERLFYSSEHYDRVETLFINLYGAEVFDINSAIYILFEGRKDVVERKEKSFFNGLINIDESCEFGKIYRVVDEWFSTTDHINKSYTEEYIFDLLLASVKCLAILREYEASNQDEFSFKKENNLLKDQFVLVYKDYECLLLNKVHEGVNRMVYDYISLSDFRKVIIEK